MARNNDRGGTGRRSSKDAGRRLKKKPCALCKDRIEWVDYKDVSMLRKYMSDRGKIRARRVSGNCTQHQRDVAIAIKTARELVLLPYTQRTTTERPGGRGRGRDGFGGRRSRDDAREDDRGAAGGPRSESREGAPRGGQTEVVEAEVIELESGEEIVVLEDEATGGETVLVEEDVPGGGTNDAAGDEAGDDGSGGDGAEG
jgi:small subunit ribosomal protein S18